MHVDSSTPLIRAVGRALPPHYVDQETLIAAFRETWGRAQYNVARLEDLHRAVQVGGRYLALPLDELREIDSFAARNSAWIAAAVDLGAAAVEDALVRSGFVAKDIDHLFLMTTTGVATPSIDARLVNRLGLGTGIKRTPIFGLGCAAGVAGTARAADYLRAFPHQTAVALSVEICSLTLQREDFSIPNIIASGLFGDGAAAVVLTGGQSSPASRQSVGSMAPQTPPVSPEHHGTALRVVTSRSVFYPDTERVMGWDVVDGGFKVVLSASVPDVVNEHIGADVDSFLADNGLDRSRVSHWIVHTGGPRVLEAFARALQLSRDSLRLSWESLHETGNLSSASVLFVLRDHLDAGEAEPGDFGLLIAMGPGFCSELVLVQW